MPVPDETSLHKGLGVRRRDIADIREAPLGELLHIGRDDERLVVLAKLVWQVDNAIENVTQDPIYQEVLRYGYNLPRDTELNDLTHTERLMLLEKRKQGARGWKLNSSNKKISEFRPRISAYWRAGKNPPTPDDQVARIVLDEEKAGQSGPDDVKLEIPPGFFQVLLRDANSAQSGAAELLLPQLPLFFEVSDTGHVVTVRTADHEQLPVFTTEEQFEAYSDPGRRRVVAKGREVLDLLAGFPDVGLSVNPIVGDKTQYHWTARDVARLRDGERTKEV